MFLETMSHEDPEGPINYCPNPWSRNKCDFEDENEDEDEEEYEEEFEEMEMISDSEVPYLALNGNRTTTDVGMVLDSEENED